MILSLINWLLAYSLELDVEVFKIVELSLTFVSWGFLTDMSLLTLDWSFPKPYLDPDACL